jgi:hypothetical protein
MTIYDVIRDSKAVESLINGLTDEETGETREVTEEEKQVFLGWINENEGHFITKFDNICRLYKNLQARAAIAAAEKETLSAEMSRLAKRAAARENEAKSLRGLLRYALEALKMTKFKTDLFSANIQNTRATARPNAVFSPDEIPVEYVTRELSSSAICDAVKDGSLYGKEGQENIAKLFYQDALGEHELKGVAYLKGSALVIR